MPKTKLTIKNHLTLHSAQQPQQPRRRIKTPKPERTKLGKPNTTQSPTVVSEEVNDAVIHNMHVTN